MGNDNRESEEGDCSAASKNDPPSLSCCFPRRCAQKLAVAGKSTTYVYDWTQKAFVLILFDHQDSGFIHN